MCVLLADLDRYQPELGASSEMSRTVSANARVLCESAKCSLETDRGSADPPKMAYRGSANPHKLASKSSATPSKRAPKGPKNRDLER